MPDFLVIGAPKAGTTALHAALARHPGLYMSAVKEPKFFLTDGPPPAKGGGPGDALTYREHIWRRPEYEALFDPAPPGTLRGESTPLYLYDRAATAPDPGDAPRGQADRGAPRPGGAGALQLDPPVVRGPGARRRLRPGLR
jgi:hypothetical protein